MGKNIHDFNRDIRKSAAYSFEKTFSKLMNNSSFGKTMENLRKRTNARLVNDTGDYKNKANKAMFYRQYLIKILLLFVKLNQL